MVRLTTACSMAGGAGGGIVRLCRALGYSIRGIRAAFRNEPAFRQEAFLSLLLLPLAFWLGGSGAEKTLLVFSLSLVLITELLNSGIEAVVDRFGSGSAGTH